MVIKLKYFPGVWLFILFIALRTINQVLFKQVALGPGGGSYIALFIDPIFYLAGLIFFAQAVVWLSVLRQFPLSFAYPFTSITFITIMVSGALFFGESISMGNVLGALVIMSGVSVIAGNHNKNQSDGPDKK